MTNPNPPSDNSVAVLLVAAVNELNATLEHAAQLGIDVYLTVDSWGARPHQSKVGLTVSRELAHLE